MITNKCGQMGIYSAANDTRCKGEAEESIDVGDAADEVTVVVAEIEFMAKKKVQKPVIN